MLGLGLYGTPPTHAERSLAYFPVGLNKRSLTAIEFAFARVADEETLAHWTMWLWQALLLPHPLCPPKNC